MRGVGLVLALAVVFAATNVCSYQMGRSMEAIERDLAAIERMLEPGDTP